MSVSAGTKESLIDRFMREYSAFLLRVNDSNSQAKNEVLLPNMHKLAQLVCSDRAGENEAAYNEARRNIQSKMIVPRDFFASADAVFDHNKAEAKKDWPKDLAWSIVKYGAAVGAGLSIGYELWAGKLHETSNQAKPDPATPVEQGATRPGSSAANATEAPAQQNARQAQ